MNGYWSFLVLWESWIGTSDRISFLELTSHYIIPARGEGTLKQVTTGSFNVPTSFYIYRIRFVLPHGFSTGQSVFNYPIDLSLFIFSGSAASAVYGLLFLEVS
jgi:hypothetical protein